MASVALVRSGAFSGTALSIGEALRKSWPGEVADIDVQLLARRTRLVPFRAAAMAEASMSGRHVAWGKTASWARGLGWWLDHELAANRPRIYVQTLVCQRPPSGLSYVVVTDRVGLEGEDDSGVRNFSGGWLRKERAFLSGARHIFVLGESTRRWLCEEYGVAWGRVSVTGGSPNMPLTRRTRPLTRCRKLLFVGTQWGPKGGPELLAAYSRLRRDMPELELTIVGCTPEIDMPGVVVVGRVPAADMAELYEEHDALALPTKSEAFGLAFVEALHKDMPCLGTAIANVPATIAGAGVVVDPPVGSDAVATALGQLLRDYPKYVVAAARRGEELRSRGGWDDLAQQMSERLRLTNPEEGAGVRGEV